MCCILACETAKPDPTVLREAERFNPHGAGVAWVNDRGRVCWVKGIQSWREVHDLIADLPLPLVVHFRLASAGGRDKRLTHPFPVNARGQNGLELFGNAAKVLFHNGTLPEWKRVAAEMSKTFKHGFPGPAIWSDTRVMALAAYYSRKAARRLARGQKVAMLSAEGLRVWNRALWQESPEANGGQGYWLGHTSGQMGEYRQPILRGWAGLPVPYRDPAPLWTDIKPVPMVEPTHGELAEFTEREYDRAKGIHEMTDEEFRWMQEEELNGR